MLGLQDQTIREVSEAGDGRRLLRVAAASLFAEYAAPGLLQLFTSRAQDLDVELSVRPPAQFPSQLGSRIIDAAIGPIVPVAAIGDVLAQRPFLKYEVALVAGVAHPLAHAKVPPGQLREQRWLLGPSATEAGSTMAAMLAHHDVPEDGQRIFQSHSAAAEEIKRGGGIGPVLTSAVAADLTAGDLVPLHAPGCSAGGTWGILTLPNHSVPTAAAELTRFIATPRATQAMLLGAGATIGHFKPSVHVTLWR
jgi:DNA-binding transcriptional LysR family regulator